MKHWKRFFTLGAAALLTITAVTGCGLKGGKAGSSTASSKTITIGAKAFTENQIVAEVYAKALEDEGYKVNRKFDISASVIHTAIQNKQIDLYPEYTGTGLITILKRQPITDAEKVYDTVKKLYKAKYQITWLDYAKANDGQGLAVTTEVAKKYHIQTISDLQKVASKLRFASQGEFDEREDGIPALEKTYGKFHWKSSKIYDNSLKYQVLSSKKADVAPVYTTEGNLSDTDKYTLLKDDKKVWPPYNLAPIVRDDVLKEHKEIAEILNKVNKKFTTENLTKLNAKVDIEKEDYEDVAEEFYDSIR